MTKTSTLAQRAGVTVRTLRYYDRIGLLKARRTAAGHRVYQDGDLIRLQQIRLLQFVGLSLEQIRALLQEPRSLRQSLAFQLDVLREKQAQLTRMIAILSDAAQRDTDLDLVTQSIEREIAMDWMKKFYDDESWEKLQQRAGSYTSAQQQADQQRWVDLYQEAEQCCDQPLQSEAVQGLARRYKALIDEFTDGDPKVLAALRAMQAERDTTPPGFPDHSKAKAFLGRALKAAGLQFAGASE